MTGSALLERLHPGRDANGSTWAVVRYPQDWRAGAPIRVTYNAGGRALELAPVARPELAADWLPLAPVAAADGTLYRADPRRHLLLAKGPCADRFVAVEGVGGRGSATGRFDTPIGVAVDGQGPVYVADAGNGRVQVILPGTGEVLAVLAEGLHRPIHVAIGAAGEIFVLDVVPAKIHVFTSRFAPLRNFALATLDPWTQTAWTPSSEDRPLGLAVLADQSLAIFDPTRPALWQMSPSGAALPALPWPEPPALPAGWMEAPRRFAADGEIVLGPIDGGVHNLAWHRVMIDAQLPAATSLTLQTFAANSPTASSIVWAPRTPVAVRAGDTDAGAADRLILPDVDAWSRWKAGRLDRAHPTIFRFEGSGPVAADRFTAPFQAARGLCVGARVVFTTDAGGQTDATVVETPPRRVTVAADGACGLAVVTAVELLARDRGPPPFGPLDLAFLGFNPATLAMGGVRGDGYPEDLEVPHALASFLRVGDVLSLAPVGARIEVLAIDDAAAEFGLDHDVEGDFSTSALSLLDTDGRLLVRQGRPESADIPAGSTITVMDDVHTEQIEVAWVDPAAGAIWLKSGLTGAITPSSWTAAQFPAPAATDRGRYLWLRLRLQGAAIAPRDGVGAPKIATATPSVRALRIIAPRPNLLDWMPALFSQRDPNEDAPGANFMERLLALFEGQFTRIEDAYESVERLLNPAAADEDWLAFVASWLELTFDPSWPVERKRALVREGAALQAGKGTPAALLRYLEIYTGARPALGESFRARPVAPIQLGARGALGLAPLGGGDARPDGFAHRFTVSVTLPSGPERAAARGTVLKIIETMKPAHTSFVFDSGLGASAGIGIDGAVGDIVIPGPQAADPCACDAGAETSGAPPGHVAGGFHLGGSLGRGGQKRRVSQGD